MLDVDRFKATDDLRADVSKALRAARDAGRREGAFAERARIRDALAALRVDPISCEDISRAINKRGGAPEPEHPAVTLLRELEWIGMVSVGPGDFDGPCCPCCNEHRPAHDLGCRLAALLKEGT